MSGWLGGEGGQERKYLGLLGGIDVLYVLACSWCSVLVLASLWGFVESTERSDV